VISGSVVAFLENRDVRCVMEMETKWLKRDWRGDIVRGQLQMDSKLAGTEWHGDECMSIRTVPMQLSIYVRL